MEPVRRVASASLQHEHAHVRGTECIVDLGKLLDRSRSGVRCRVRRSESCCCSGAMRRCRRMGPVGTTPCDPRPRRGARHRRRRARGRDRILIAFQCKTAVNDRDNGSWSVGRRSRRSTLRPPPPLTARCNLHAAASSGWSTPCAEPLRQRSGVQTAWFTCGPSDALRGGVEAAKRSASFTANARAAACHRVEIVGGSSPRGTARDTRRF